MKYIDDERFGQLHRIVHILTWICFIPFMAGIFLILGVSLFTTVYYDLHQEADLPRFGNENIPLLLLLTAAAIGLVYLLSRKTELLQGRSSYIVSAD